MKASELKELAREVNLIDLSDQAAALAELKSVLGAVVDHLFFSQLAKEIDRT